MLNIEFIRINPEATLPEYASSGASGFDLRAVLGKEVVIEPGHRALIGTGLAWQPPSEVSFNSMQHVGAPADPNHHIVPGMAFRPELQIRSRSGMAYKQGVHVLNSPGTIDNDYRGEIGVVLQNSGSAAVTITHGDRIAQGVIVLVPICRISEGRTLNDTERGSGGFGSTGTR